MIIAQCKIGDCSNDFMFIIVERKGEIIGGHKLSLSETQHSNPIISKRAGELLLKNNYYHLKRAILWKRIGLFATIYFLLRNLFNFENCEI